MWRCAHRVKVGLWYRSVCYMTAGRRSPVLLEVVLRTVAVIALKGGSGKTTIAMHLALAAHLRGLDTLVADIDPQRSAEGILSTRPIPGPAWMTIAGARLMAAKFTALSSRRQLLVIDTPAGA